MRRISLLLPVFLISVSSHAFAADPIVADSHLKAVTVYANRAALTREATVMLPAGAQTIVFKGLSASLLADSLRAKGKAVADVKFGAVTSKLVPGAELVAPREKALNDQLQALRDKGRGIEAEKQALSAKQNFLETLGRQGSLRARENIAEINLKPKEWAAAADVIYKGTDDILKGQIAQDMALRALDEQIGKVEQELQQLQTGQRNVYEVTLPVEASAATKLTVDLSYQIPQATWHPIYDARLNTKTGKLEITQYGAVRQNSGEDWNGVALTLSTAQPSRGAGLPDLQTMWVSLYQAVAQGVAFGSVDPAYRRALMTENKMKVDMAAASGGSALPLPIAISRGSGLQIPQIPQVPQSDVLAEWGRVARARQEATFTHASINTGGFVSEYKIPGPSTVKADGTKSKLMIGTFDTADKLVVEVKPQLSTAAYLVAQMKLKGDAPILPGPVSLFRDGAFVGRSHLPLLRPEQEKSLAFGIDDQVSVKRNVLKDKRSEAGVIARDNVLERNFVTTLQNLHKDKINVAVLETVPVSQDEKIDVEILKDKTTAGYQKDLHNVKGLLRWDVPLAAKQKTDVKLGWKVAWPKDRSISGL